MSKLNQIMQEIDSVLSNVSMDAIESFVQNVCSGNRIFVVGEGRSGLMAKSFAMRLMHLGATVYVVGETITPALAKGDVLVAISGSGTTKSVIYIAEKAKALGCLVLVMTTNLSSEIGLLADFILHVPAATKYRVEGEHQSIQPLGSLFDQCAHLVFDTVCLGYAEQKFIDNQSAFAKHSNLE
jgi:6-phospho-3-hexuloisomerase